MLKIFWLFSNTKIDFSNNFPKSYKNVLYIKFYFTRMLLTSTIYFVMKFLYWMSELWTCIAFILQFSPSKNTSWKYNWSLTLSWVSVLELSVNEPSQSFTVPRDKAPPCLKRLLVASAFIRICANQTACRLWSLQTDKHPNFISTHHIYMPII